MHTTALESLPQDQGGQPNTATASGGATDGSAIPNGNRDPSEPPEAAAPALPPHVKLIEMGTAFLASKVVYAAAKLGLADHLDSKPMTAAELTQLIGVSLPFSPYGALP